MRTSGLVGRVGGFVYEPDIDSGFFVPEDRSGVLYPQTINLTCEFTVMHTHRLGWKTGGDSLRLDGGEVGGYPYGEEFSEGSRGIKRTEERSPKTEASKDATAMKMLRPNSFGGGRSSGGGAGSGF